MQRRKHEEPKFHLRDHRLQLPRDDVDDIPMQRELRLHKRRRAQEFHIRADTARQATRHFVLAPSRACGRRAPE